MNIQQIRNDIDHQKVANEHNLTVYVYELENGDEVFCFVADLKPSNSFFTEYNQRSYVKKFLRKIEPQTTGHHTAYRFFTSYKAAEIFAFEVTQKFKNTNYHIEAKKTKRGNFYRVSIINLTDEQYESDF